MKIEETPLAGAYVITPEPVFDERGAFARLFCADTFAAHGLASSFEQVSVSVNARAGTLRGLHLQRPPHAEVKLIRATVGAVFDVIVDVRAASPTFGQWHAVELSAENRRMFYVPAGFAHGFQSLRDASELVYHITPPYAAGFQDGVCFDDPALAIPWPDPAGAILSDRDRLLPLLADFEPVAV
ncbi:MAG: dTDP-4-dehydrorhamnose 3,5-epimerase [Caulobacteraceae bacterium]|nr:dTDP-4-dehydrorhamnose 3,5-epimerase [Caulobacteraceae bacterium]